jgi:hypothetical protein
MPHGSEWPISAIFGAAGFEALMRQWGGESVCVRLAKNDQGESLKTDWSDFCVCFT